MPPPQPLSEIHPKKKVRVEEPEDNGAVEIDEDVLNQDDEGQQQHVLLTLDTVAEVDIVGFEFRGPTSLRVRTTS